MKTTFLIIFCAFAAMPSAKANCSDVQVKTSIRQLLATVTPIALNTVQKNLGESLRWVSLNVNKDDFAPQYALNEEISGNVDFTGKNSHRQTILTGNLRYLCTCEMKEILPVAGTPGTVSCYVNFQTTRKSKTSEKVEQYFDWLFNGPLFSTTPSDGEREEEDRKTPGLVLYNTTGEEFFRSTRGNALTDVNAEYYREGFIDYAFPYIVR